MSGPFTLRIVRPYANRDAYLRGDAWTVGRSEMLLVGVEGVAPGATVSFEIVLENREIVVRGEGRAMEIVPHGDDHPGGVRIRFKQLDLESKAMLRRALETQRRIAAEQRALAASADATTAEEPARAEPPQASPADAEPAQRESGEVVAGPSASNAASTVETTREEPSGVHHRLVGPVRAPENREELLERLRERSRLRKGSVSVPKSSAAAE